MKQIRNHIAVYSILSLSLISIPGTVTADRTTSYTYNSLGLVETIDGPRLDVSDITTYGYDAQGNRDSTTNALGHQTRVTAYDASNRPLTIVDPNGLFITLDYDPRGRLTQQTQSDGATSRATQFGYDPVGNLTRITQPDGSYISYEYDEANRLTAITDSQGNRIDYTLDAMGNRLSEQVRDSLGLLTRSQQKVYDDLSQVRQLIDSRSNVTNYAYDANGNLTESIDANLNPSNQTYNVLDRITEHTNALDGETQYGYDDKGNLISVKAPNNLTTYYSYDAYGNLTQLRSPDTGTTNYTYDEAGNRLTQTDARNITVNYSYDALNRLAHTSYPDASLNVTYNYDQGANGIGRLTSMSDANGTTNYVYNAYGDLINLSRTSNDGIVTSFAYGYDSHGRLIDLTYPSGNSVHYAYDAYGQLASLDYEWSDGTTQSLVSNLQTLPFGPVASLVYGNGLTLTRTFDQDYRLTDQTIPGVMQSSYQHDPVGNIIDWMDLLDTGRDQQFGYDFLDRLTAAIGEYGSLSYTYDAIGNRSSITIDGTSETYRYAGGTNWLQYIYSNITDTRDYDAVGNTIQSHIGSYTYDDTNRMVSFTRTGVSASYAYNGKGERIRKTVNDSTVRFRYAPSGELLGEYDAGGQAIREYVYLEGQPLAQIWGESGGDNSPTVLQFTEADVLSYGGSFNDKTGTMTVEADGTALRLIGNLWKRISFPYTITAETVLEFDFESGIQGEIHGIGFETNDSLSSNRVFKLYGTQRWGIRDYATYNGDGTMHFKIPVGEHFTGTFGWLVFVNDQDISNPTAESLFSNIQVYEDNGLPPADSIAPPAAGSGGLYYLHTDHLGSVVKATDSTQSLVWDVVRKPFGERMVVTEQIQMPLGFPGQYYDQESNNYYNYFRDYDPAIGRYLQSDPIGLWGGFNTYAYVDGNPLIYYDYFGLFGMNDVYAGVYWATGGWSPSQSTVDYAAGFGDTISMGMTDWIRDQLDANNSVNKCSSAYSAGEWTGVGFGFAAGGAAGWRAGGRKAAGTEFSHWIPNRMRGPRSRWNGNYVSPRRHYYHDPYRYPSGWRNFGPKLPKPAQQFDRIPNPYKGAAAGAGAAGASAAGDNCECQ